MPLIKRVERVALSVENLDAARDFFETVFDANFEPLEVIEDMNMRYQPFTLGESRMELLEASRDESPVSRLLAKHRGQAFITSPLRWTIWMRLSPNWRRAARRSHTATPMRWA